MILSHKHKFIFIHGQKTAGSSLNSIFNPYLGALDIQTGTWEETIKNGGRFNWRTLGILTMGFPRLLGSSAKWTVKNKRITSNFNLTQYHQLISHHYKKKYKFKPETPHATAGQVRTSFPKEWESYFKFTIVRNPWDHAVSYYYWKLHEKRAKNISFKEFLKRFYDVHRPDPEGIRPRYRTNWDIYAIDDRVAVDYVARFEDLDSEIRIIGDRIGLPVMLDKKVKGNIRDKSKTLAEHYDYECVNLVARIYQKEIEYFGYDTPFILPYN